MAFASFPTDISLHLDTSSRITNWGPVNPTFFTRYLEWILIDWFIFLKEIKTLSVIEIGWRLFGLSKEQYGALHLTFMVLFLVGGIWHIVLNWGPLVKYLKNRARKLRIFTPEFNVALGLTLLFLVGTLAAVPPWSSYLGWEEDINDYWEKRDGSPPWGHAEDNTLARFARGLVDWERLEHQRHVTLSSEVALESLRNAELQVESDRQKLIDIARVNDTTPQAIMGILRGAARPREPGDVPEPPVAGGSKGPYPVPPSGLGRLTLRSYCEKYSIDLDQTLKLFPRGQKVDPDQRLRELATALGTDPEGIVELLNERSRRPNP